MVRQPKGATMDSREEIWAAFEKGPEVARQMVAPVPAEAMTWHPPDGGWTIQEILNHLADSELVYANRIHWFIAEPGTTVPGYDQDHWAQALGAGKRDGRVALETFCAVRDNTAELLRALGTEAWSRQGAHSERGSMTVQDLVATVAGHAQEHSEQVAALHSAWRSAK
jgi:uncharacterized damage-inducible protein DinB